MNCCCWENEDKLTVIQLTGQTEEDSNSYQNNQLMLSRCRQCPGHPAGITASQRTGPVVGAADGSLGNQKAGYRFKLEGRQTKLEQQQAQAEDLLRQAGQLKQKAKLLQDLENNLEGFAYSVKAVMKQSRTGWLEGIHGTVARLLEVPEEYALAIETALGGSMQHIVVENEAAAKSAIRFLKQKNAGRATFLPLTSVKGRELSGFDLSDQEGYVDLASHLVKADSRYQGIVDSLLGRIVVAEDLDCAAAMGKQFGYRFKIVTLDGQVVNAGGSFSGGSKSRSAGLLSRAGEIAQLQQQAGLPDPAFPAAKPRQQKVRAGSQHLKGPAKRIGKRTDHRQGRSDPLRRGTETAGSSGGRIFPPGQGNGAGAGRLFGTAPGKESENCRPSPPAGRNPAGAGAGPANFGVFAGAGRSASPAAPRGQRFHSKVAVGSTGQAKGCGFPPRNHGTASGTKPGIGAAAKTVDGSDSAGKAARAQQQQEIQDCIQKRESNGLAQQKLDKQVKEILQQRTQLEQATTQLREEEKQYSRQREEVSRQLAQLEQRRETLQKEYDEVIRKLWEEYELTRSQARQEAQDPKDPAQAKTRLAAVKGEIRSLGSVNLSAIEEYQEVSQRYEFMSAQLADVEQSRKELEDLIQQLTQKMEELFAQSFEAINQNFQKIFVDLFGGGHGELKLTDPEHLLESGIEIIVQPPGKVIRHLSALSGGEQSFVAIAIYFAILKVRPAPFCILDEIEAALDDVNVARYAEYLRIMSDKTQFIAITHRRGTMEEADVLYGVTMQEKGVSKLLKLDVSEVAGQSQIA